MNKNTLLIILVILILVIGGSAIYYITSNQSKTANVSTNTSSNEVTIQSMAFTPNELKVAKGTTVTWTNKDIFAHTVTSDSNIFDSKEIAMNAHFSYTFNETGIFTYHCNIHSTMRAKVIVE